MKIRLTQPKNNKYYIRTVSGGLNGAVAGKPTISGANVLCNCVGYANGRFNEIINDPELKGVVLKFKYQLVCNAENFIESAKKQGLKINSTPIQGGIMVWQRGKTISGSDGAGHVAVVEEVYDDGTILTSESGWNAWAFKAVRRSNSNGRWGQTSAYKFRGCIINPAVKDAKVVPAPKLTVDGIGGANTVRAMQKFFGTPQDGVLSGQNRRSQSKYYPSITAVEFGKGGSICVKKLQKWCQASADGVLGANTIQAWQKKLKAEGYYNGEIDSIFGSNSMKAWQRFLNDKLFKKETEPQEPEEKPSTPVSDEPPYKVIDVSDWQDQIDWAKVKAAGVVGAIIRYADGNTLDKRFEENMKNAKAAGLHIGSYIFSRAKSKAEAEKEAERLFNACLQYDLDMPMYIDLEASGLGKYADEVAPAFLNRMASLGGKGGVYANLNWWNNYLKITARDYSSNPFWIAQYNSTMDYKPADRMGMWQYSSSGTVDGIKGKVDMDWCYIDYWKSAKTKQQKAVEYGEKLAKDDSYHYVVWDSGNAKTKQCPVCRNFPNGKYKGFNCIRLVFTCWSHAGIPCKHEGALISNGVGDKMYNASDAEMLKLAQDAIGCKDIVVLRNKSGFSDSQLKVGDACMHFEKGVYKHIYLYAGNGMMVDSGNWSDTAKQIAVRKRQSCQIVIRYVGK